MDELQAIRALRPDAEYPPDRRLAARTLLLSEASSAVPDPRAHPARPAGSSHAARRPRDARRRLAWRGGLTGLTAAAAAAAIAVVAVHPQESRPGADRATVTSGGAAQLLALAAQTARVQAAAVPAGARWRVTEVRDNSTAWAAPQCTELASVASGSPYDLTEAIHGYRACLYRPPAALPKLRGAKPIPASAVPHFGRLPSRPGSLLAAIYRKVRAQPADHLPGHPPGNVAAADVNEAVFGEIVMMLNSGVTSPSVAVQLQAIARIPGATVTRGARSAIGRPGIAISVAGSIDRNSILLDPVTHELIGDTDAVKVPGGRVITMMDVQLWQAYYNRDGKRV
jgi:hypothetical protein